MTPLPKTGGLQPQCASPKGAPCLRGRRASSAALLAILLSVLAGCRSQPYVNAHIESVNAEYRQLEDYVYALEAENARLQQEIDSLRLPSTTSRSPAGQSAPGRGGIFRRSPSATPNRRQPETETAPPTEGPVIEMPGSTPPAQPSGRRSTLQRPETVPTAPADTPPNVELPARRPENLSPPAEEPLPLPAAPHGDVGPSVPGTIELPPTDRKITHLFLNPLATGGADFNGQPGDDGLRIVVEPRNASDQFVAEAGTISVVLLDPDREGEAARVARWDFDQSATRQLLAASTPGRGIKLEMPWPAAAPDANRLKLFVRYETPDGRRLQADREIFVAQPGQVISRWTPRPLDRQPATELATALGDNADFSTAVRSASAAATPARPAWLPNR